MKLRLGAAVLAIFTAWITWRAKAIELGPALNRAGHLPAVGKPAPAFNLAALDGHRVSLADYRGHHVIVTFWASWCGPCRMEMPLLTTFYKRGHELKADFEILAISVDSVREDAVQAAAELKVPFPVLLDLDEKVSGPYGVEAIPTILVIDPQGNVGYAHTGLDTGLEFLLAQQVGIKNYSPIATPGASQ
jgi:peroxiredoxin